MIHASLFSGIGAAELAAEWMGWRNAFHCETQGFPRRVLEYWYPNSQSYEDIAKTDFAPWRGRIDVLTGGFPCQSFSCAGKRQGADDDRYLWPEMLRAIREIQPSWVVGENVAGILTMVQSGSEFEMGSESTLFGEDNEIWERRQQYVVETVCQDLENEGYSVQPFVIPACAVGAPHRRDRVFFVARRVASDTRRDRFGKREDEQEPVEEREGTPDNRACGQNGASPHPDVHGHTPREEDEGTEGIGGGDNLKDYCKKRFKSGPHFTETIGHCDTATIWLIYKKKPNGGFAEMYLLFMEHYSGIKSYDQITKEVSNWDYEKIRADKTSIIIG